jgi:IclR family KDG regulon transcriptional repressor
MYSINAFVYAGKHIWEVVARTEDHYASNLTNAGDHVAHRVLSCGRMREGLRGHGMTSSSTSYQLESVQRALRVLDCFTAETPELRLIDISRMLEINKVQALRLASTLESQGFLVRDPRTKYYRLGLRLFQLGMIVQQQSEIQRVAHLMLHDLVAETGETARIMLPHENGPTCIDLVESPRQYRVFGKLGGFYPWHAGTSTKLLLAYQPIEFQERILSNPLERYTATTTTDPDQLRSQFQLIRERGYHVSSNDIEWGATAIAAPVFDKSGEVVAAVSVSGPSERLDAATIERVLGLVLATSGDISRSLGYVVSSGHFLGQSMRSADWVSRRASSIISED